MEPTAGGYTLPELRELVNGIDVLCDLDLDKLVDIITALLDMAAPTPQTLSERTAIHMARKPVTHKTMKLPAELHQRLKAWQVVHGHKHGTMTLADTVEDIIKGDLPSLPELEQQAK